MLQKVQVSHRWSVQFEGLCGRREKGGIKKVKDCEGGVRRGKGKRYAYNGKEGLWSR